MELVWLDKEGAAALPGPVLGLLLFMAVELRSKLHCASRSDRSCAGQPGTLYCCCRLVVRLLT